MTSAAFDPAAAFAVGRIIAPHGVRGELKVEALTDFLDRFSAGSGLWMDGREVIVERARWTGQAVLLKLRGLEDRNAAEALRGKQFLVSDKRDLEADTYYRDDIVGLKVIDQTGGHLGQVAEIFETGSNDVYVIKGERGELLIPATEEVVQAIDFTAGTLVVDLIEGLEWERPARKKPKRVPAVKRTKAKAKAPPA